MLILNVNDARWAEFVEACPSASPFHHPAWANLLAECYGYQPMALGVADYGGDLVAGLPALEVRGLLGRRRWVALPFTDYCPVLTRADRPGGLAQLAQALIDEREARSLTAVEVHGDLPGGGDVHLVPAAFRHTQALSSDLKALFRQFSGMHQRNVRKAERNGMEVHFGRGAADLEEFYRLHLLTRRRLGVPIQPRRFFDLLAARVLDRRIGFVMSARIDGTPVASAVFLNWNGVLVYKYGASDARFWGLRPNHSLFWTALRWAVEHGYHTFDWGRSDDTDHGLRAFKSGWGATEERLTYAVVAAMPPHPGRGATRRVLSAVIRRSPTWVCQAVGELLYRYAA